MSPRNQNNELNIYVMHRFKNNMKDFRHLVRHEVPNTDNTNHKN